MFTGLIQDLGVVRAADAGADGLRLRIDTALSAELKPGDSVAVNGVCLTATQVEDGCFAAEVMQESLERSSLADLTPGVMLNLELPLRAGERLGGHVVQGHVDGLGTVVDTQPDGFALRVRIEPPQELLRYVIEKGSIAVDGISLTVAELDRRSFTVSLIPETLERTNLRDVRPGTKVNLEVDLMAKYVERLIGTKP